ncbi:response regulator transcription factor [Nitrincola alkalilacustris]|uniref:response regulator n=1 Tax=Nitrincola alkalilacustris TaxID=1571224 RepID=UPI00124C6142|nr:response regulator transcription factor [Nitrincola alkalilacustris]
MKKEIRLLLVDDHSIIRAGYQQILQRDPEIQVVAEAESSHCALEAYRRHKPDVVMLDLAIPQKKDSQDISTAHGLETIRRILLAEPEAKVLVLTAMNTEPYPSQVMQTGACGYLTKHCAPDELLKALHAVFDGRKYLSKSISAEIESSVVNEQLVGKLSHRELEIFTMLAESYSVSDIANTITISPKTVHAHRANILRKLCLKSNAEIVRLAIRQGIIES